MVERLKPYIGELVPAIVSSDYKRAHMTAEAIADVTGLPIAIQESLRERNFGDARGVAQADLGVDLYAADFHPRGGESWSMFHERVTVMTISCSTRKSSPALLMVVSPDGEEGILP